MKRKRTNSNEKVSISYSENYGFLGHLLYSERLIQGMSIEKVALELNLSTYIIKNLETGFFNRTPGLAYMVGFLRTYASYLGLNGKEISSYVTPLKETFFEEEPILKTSFQQKQLPSQPVLWGAIFALSLVLLGYIWLDSLYKTPHQLNLIVVNDDQISVPKPDNYLNDETERSINHFLSIYHKPFVQTHSNQPLIFQICCNSDTWIALKDLNGHLVRQGVLHKGDNIKLPIDFEGVLHTGNAGGIYVRYGTQVSSAFGSTGQVIQNFRVNLKKILQNPSNPVNN
jgi:cytoskeleton protein RodZ